MSVLINRAVVVNLYVQQVLRHAVVTVLSSLAIPPHLVHESLSCLANKLKPYGFIRIHRSVVVNISAVEDIQALPTGEYRLRVRGGMEYLVTRTYKHNLRDLAQLWAGSQRLCG